MMYSLMDICKIMQVESLLNKNLKNLEAEKQKKYIFIKFNRYISANMHNIDCKTYLHFQIFGSCKINSKLISFKGLCC